MSKLNRFPTYFLAGLLLISASACEGLIDRIKGPEEKQPARRELQSNLNISAIQEIEKTLDGLSQNAPAYDRNHDFYSSSLKEIGILKTAYNDLKEDLPNQLNDAVKIFELLTDGKSQQMRSPGRESNTQIVEAQERLRLDSSDGLDGETTFKAAIRLREQIDP